MQSEHIEVFVFDIYIPNSVGRPVGSVAPPARYMPPNIYVWVWVCVDVYNIRKRRAPRRPTKTSESKNLWSATA